ncbi:MAG: sugar ABC transporter substrate-binding protein [Anaerolineae bacterium]|nr:sugar ABC transporter substrate-binding protein [Anaerolineae bacterium]
MRTHVFKAVRRSALILAVFSLVIAVGAVAFVPGVAAQEPVTIGFAYGSFAPQEKWEVYFADFLAAHPEVTINYIPVPLDDGWGDYTQKIITLMVGGESVDIIWNAIEAVPLMADKGVLRELDSFMADDPDIQGYIDDVNPQLLQGLRWKDQQFLLPFAWNAVLMYYNKQVFADAGVAEPAADWTWDDFLAAAQQLTQDTNGDGTPDIWGFQTGFSTWSLGPWPISNGSFWLSEDFSEPWYTRPETIEAVQFARDLIWEHGVAPSGDFSPEAAFAAGTLAMFPAAPATREGLLASGMSADQYDVAYWPTKTGDGTHGTIWGTDGYGITTNSQHPDIAWAMLKELVSNNVMSSLLSGQYASASAPARTSLAHDPRLVEASPANYLYFYDALAGARTVINSPIFAELGEIHSRYMSQVWANEMSVEDAMTNIQAEMEAAIAEAAE